MTKGELLEKFDQVKAIIGVWDIEPDFLTHAGFVLGCYKDPNEDNWKIYETDERGFVSVYFQADKQEEAYDRLYDLIKIHKDIVT